MLIITVYHNRFREIQFHFNNKEKTEQLFDYLNNMIIFYTVEFRDKKYDIGI